MQRPVWKIEAQIKILKRQLDNTKPERIDSWYKLNNKIKTLESELIKAKNFEFLAK